MNAWHVAMHACAYSHKQYLQSGVFSILSQLDPHKAGGPDNIPARVLKELAYDLTPIATYPPIPAITEYW